MTDLNGKYWIQPLREHILTDDKHAVMSTFADLPEYSSTKPSGVYPGKMWRRHDGIHDMNRRAAYIRGEITLPWLLCWYGPDEVRDNRVVCSINFREILLTDGELPR
jgi:hypothetical protein